MLGTLTSSMNLSSAILAHFLLKERLQQMGLLGCISCIVGSVVIVIHAPQEQMASSVQEIWTLATQPGFTCNMILIQVIFSSWFPGSLLI